MSGSNKLANTTLKAGNKTLTFIDIIKDKKVRAGQTTAFDEQKFNLAQAIKETNPKLSKSSSASKKKRDPNLGSPVFEFKDAETGLSQKFVFNLRYYVGAYWDDEHDQNAPNKQQDGAYEFAPTGFGETQRSYKYADINIKRCKFRQNNDSAEYLLMFEQKYSKFRNSTTDKLRASARI